MRIHVTTAVVSNSTSYAAGDKVTLSDPEAQRLINGGFAIRLIELGVGYYEQAAEVQGYRKIASASGIVGPSGSYYWDSANCMHVIHPSGARAVIDMVHLLPGWSP